MPAEGSASEKQTHFSFLEGHLTTSEGQWKKGPKPKKKLQKTSPDLMEILYEEHLEFPIPTSLAIRWALPSPPRQEVGSLLKN